MSYIVNNSDSNKINRSHIGGKAYHLSLLTKYNVPNWFALTTEAFSDYLEQANLNTAFYEILANTNATNSKENSATLQELILKGEFRNTIKELI